MWSPNELLKIEKQRDILSYITLQFFHFKKVPLEHCPLLSALLLFLEVYSLFTDKAPEPLRPRAARRPVPASAPRPAFGRALRRRPP